MSRALFALEEVELLFVDRSGQRNPRKGDRTAWMTINYAYARLHEMGLVTRPDHGTRFIQLKRTLPAPPNKSSYNVSGGGLILSTAHPRQAIGVLSSRGF